MTRLRMGLVGGGEGAFIGAVHRIAAELDGRIELVCGAFSSNPSRSKRFGQELYDLPPNRSYGTFNEMVTEELRLPTEERMRKRKGWEAAIVGACVPTSIRAWAHANVHICRSDPVGLTNILNGMTLSHHAPPADSDT